MFLLPTLLSRGRALVSGPETELVGKLGFCLAFCFWEPDAQPAGARSLLHKNLFQQTLCPPLPKGNPPLAWWKKSMDIIFGLGTASAVPSQCPRPNNNPF